jgi:hypothetical protein
MIIPVSVGDKIKAEAWSKWPNAFKSDPTRWITGEVTNVDYTEFTTDTNSWDIIATGRQLGEVVVCHQIIVTTLPENEDDYDWLKVGSTCLIAIDCVVENYTKGIKQNTDVPLVNPFLRFSKRKQTPPSRQ